MRRVWLLLRAQIINTFSINEILEPGSHKRNSSFVVAIGVFTIALFLCAYNVMSALTLVQLHEQEQIPAYMVAVSSFAIVFMTMFRSNGVLFGTKDYDMLSSLPVKSSEIISSKFLFMYLINLIVALVFMAPGGVIWAIHTELGILSVALYFFSIFIVPFIPMCIAAILGVLIVVISSRFKQRSVFALLFSFASLGLVGYVGMSSMRTQTDVVDIGVLLMKQISGLYPLSRWFMATTDVPVWISICGFILLSAIVFALFIRMIAARHQWLHSMVSAVPVHTTMQKLSTKRRSKFMALYQKEFRRFLSSYMTVLNTGLGVVLLILFSIALLFLPIHQLESYVGIQNIEALLPLYAPLLVSALLSLSCPAASSISLEGKNIWILQSSPVSVTSIVNSKLAVNLTLHGIGYLFAILSLSARLILTIEQFIGLILIPIVYSLFTAVLGISLNKKFPNYEWQSEVVVVKQSLPVLISIVVSMIAVAAPMLLHMILSLPLMPILWSASAILLLVTYGMYRNVRKSTFI